MLVDAHSGASADAGSIPAASTFKSAARILIVGSRICAAGLEFD